MKKRERARALPKGASTALIAYISYTDGWAFAFRYVFALHLAAGVSGTHHRGQCQRLHGRPLHEAQRNERADRREAGGDRSITPWRRSGNGRTQDDRRPACMAEGELAGSIREG